MKHKIIPLKDYLIIVDDSEIKEGHGWHPITNNISEHHITDNNLSKGWRKIIAHLPLNNSPVLSGVDLLPSIEDEVKDVENRVIVAAQQYALNEVSHFGVGALTRIKCAWEEGFKIAKETFKYTEEDLRKAYNEGTNQGAFYEMLVRDEDWKAVDDFIKNDNSKVDKFIQLLQQPKLPVEFECALFWSNSYGSKVSSNGYDVKNLLPKTITNSQGQKVWIGKYIY